MEYEKCEECNSNICGAETGITKRINFETENKFELDFNTKNEFI